MSTFETASFEESAGHEQFEWPSSVEVNRLQTLLDLAETTLEKHSLISIEFVDYVSTVAATLPGLDPDTLARIDALTAAAPLAQLQGCLAYVAKIESAPSVEPEIVAGWYHELKKHYGRCEERLSPAEQKLVTDTLGRLATKLGWR